MNRAARRSAAKRARRKSAAILSGSALATTGLSFVATPPAAAELLPEVDTAEELVDAVEAANGDVEPDHDGIVIAEGAEISLAGELRITQPLSIYGNGAAVYAADGERIFYIEPTAGAVEIHDLALYGGGEVGGDGGAIFSRADLTLDHVRIGGFRAESDGGGLSVVGADLTIVDSSITGNSAHGNGGGIHAEGGDRVVIRHSDLGENRSYEGYGGGVYVYAHELLVDRSELAENFALTSLGYVGGDGGGLFFWGREDGAGRLNVVDSVFTANRADHEESGDTSDYLGSGGAIVVGGEARYVDIRRSAFVENEAERGGSIHADAAGLEIVVSDSEFIGDRFLGDGEDVENALRDGGAIDVSIERLRISDSSFEALFAEAGDGGAIRTFQTDVTIERSRFAENRAIDSGGALTVVEGEAYISASLFENNEVDNQTGGAIHVDSALVEVVNTTLYGNVADDAGGAIATEGSSDLALVHSTITSNLVRSDWRGGGVYLGDAGGGADPEITALNSVVAGNAVDLDAPVANDVDSFDSVAVNEIEATVIGTAANDGGVDLVAAGFTVPGTELEMGDLDDNGGRWASIVPDPSLVDAGADVEWSLTADGRDLVSRVVDGDGVDGARPDIGALEVVDTTSAGTTIEVDSDSFDDGIRDAVLRANSTVAADTITIAGLTELDAERELRVIHDVTITGGASQVTIDGGEDPEVSTDLDTRHRIFSFESYGGEPVDVTLSNLELVDGLATGPRGEPPLGGADGGAIHGTGNLVLQDVDFLGNEALYDGGAVFVYDGSLSVTGSDFELNTAGDRGGAIHLLEADGAISILDTSFFDNHAGDDDGDSGGGAVSVDGGESTITMDDVLMVENTTAGDGGAVFVGGSGGVIDIDIDDTTFQDNHAYDGHGGALSVVGTEGNLYLTGVNVSENTALGNGGGINASSAGVFVTDSLLALNTSGDEGLGGGGINVEDGALEIVNSTISGNVGELGGGVRINDSAESTIAHTTFAGNTADISGALYAEDTHVVLDHVVVASEPSAYPEISTGLGGSAEVTWSFFEHDPGAIADGTGNVVDEDPLLGDLVGDGDTAVHVPEEGSPLIDEGDPSLTADDLPELDQREEARLSGVAVDIGSVEVQQAEEEPEEPEEPEAPGGSDDDDDDDGDEEQPASAPLPRTPARRDGSAAVPDRSVAGTEGSPVRVDPPATGRETTEVSVPTAAGPVSVIVDTDAGSGSSTIAVTSTPVGETTANASGFVLLGTAFEVDVEGAAAETGGVVCFPYDDDDVAAAGLDEDELELFHFDEDGNREIVTTTRDTVSNRICGAVDSFSPFAIGDLATERLAGGTAARTAAAVSRATFDPGVPVVYVTARGADGLGAGAAAAFGNGPVLLVDRDGVPSSTERELERLRPARVVVVGGTAVVSDAVVSAVGGTRVSGADRYATAAAVSAATFPSAGTVYVASGESTPDALVASVAAAAAGAPLLLVEPDAVPATTRVEIARLGATRVVVVGGSAAVSDAVASALGATRIAGADRYATAAEVARSLGRSTVLVARGDDPVDAIAGIPAADHRGAAILLVHPDAIPAVVRDVLASLSPTAMSILGGTGAITQQNEVDLAGFLD